MKRRSTSGSSSSSIAALVDQRRWALDLPTNLRFLLGVVAACGVVIVVIASLAGGQGTTVGMDKIIHFTGYMVLAFVVTMALPPPLWIPAALALLGLGYGIELIQPHFGRGSEWADMVANAWGVGIGSSLGFGIRVTYRFVSREIATAAAKRNIRRYREGEVILREGDAVRRFYIIQVGAVEYSRLRDGRHVVLGTAGPGDVLGVVPLVQGIPQIVTVTALADTRLFGMDLNQLIESAGGRSQPVATVLAALTDILRRAGDDLTDYHAAKGSRNGGPR